MFNGDKIKINKLMTSGFISYVILEMSRLLFALWTGQFHAMPGEFTWEKFYSLSVTLSFGVGLLGVLIGYFFGKFQHRIPFNNIYVKSIAYHLVILILISFYKGISYLTSLDFAFSVALIIFVGWFFIRFYKLIAKGTGDPIINDTEP
ncbi:MAG: hypothetical protein A2X59_06200 [Nitrospirae bacterium GWC2_42_7]|nr:MAG: hypothetical protein A2X59_06200 [Nitrospirae bacterium GWC2_42_7]